MTTYIVEPGNIAAVCYAYPKGEQRGESLIYLAADKQPATLTRNDADQFKHFESLPLSVRAAVNKHFYAVFSVPVEKRGEYLSNCIPWEVEAE